MKKKNTFLKLYILTKNHFQIQLIIIILKIKVKL